MPSSNPLSRSDDIAVHVSNVSSPSAPDVATIPDDDPSYPSSDINNCFNLLNQGWVPHENNESDNEASFDEPDTEETLDLFALDDNRDCSTGVALNAININFPSIVQHSDVFPDYGAPDDSSVDSSTVSRDSCVIQEGSAPEVDDDPNALRAQIDTGAFASVTDQLHMLHGYREFSASFPCPVKLEPAKEGSDIYPQGVGYLHVPALNARGHIPVRTFYSPSLRTTVIDERDFLRSRSTKYNDFLGERIQKYNDAGTFTYHASHRLRSTQDVNVHGILRHGKCYTGPLISPDPSESFTSHVTYRRHMRRP